MAAQRAAASSRCSSPRRTRRSSRQPPRTRPGYADVPGSWTRRGELVLSAVDPDPRIPVERIAAPSCSSRRGRTRCGTRRTRSPRSTSAATSTAEQTEGLTFPDAGHGLDARGPEPALVRRVRRSTGVDARSRAGRGRPTASRATRPGRDCSRRSIGWGATRAERHAPLRYHGDRSWPSRSERPPSRAATSAARSTPSPRRASRRARTAARRSSRTASARPARRIAVARSSRSGLPPRRRRAMTVRVAVDALGGDHAPDEVVAGASQPPPRRSRRSSSGPRLSTRRGSSSSPAPRRSR